MTLIPRNLETKLQTKKDNLTQYAKANKSDEKLIKIIKEKIFDSKRKELLNNCKKLLESNFNTILEHQNLTNIAINPFIDIQGTSVPIHQLIMIDPFVSLKDLPLKKNFDALILNQEEKFNTLIFLETKTSDFREKLLNQVIEKIQEYESAKMQNFIKAQLKPLEINRIEYVLVIEPHRYDTPRRILSNKEINVKKENGSIETTKIPLIIWTVNHDLNKPFYYYLLMQPYNDNYNEAKNLRQYHLNKNLVKYLSAKDDFPVSTPLISLDFSPVLDFNYQFINATPQLLKLNESPIFNKQNLYELIEGQLFPNLRIKENIEYITDTIINKGLKTKIYVKGKEIEEYKIRLRRRKDTSLIQEEIKSKICAIKIEEKLNSIDVQLEIYKKIEEIFLSSPKRKFRTVLELPNDDN